MTILTPKRIRHPRITRADLERTADFLRMMGAKVASVETEPGKIRITTTEGAGLTLADDDANLDRELQEHIARRHGHG